MSDKRGRGPSHRRAAAGVQGFQPSGQGLTYRVSASIGPEGGGHWDTRERERGKADKMFAADRAEKGRRMAVCTTRGGGAKWWNEERHGPHPLHRRRCLLHILKPISVVEFYV